MWLHPEDERLVAPPPRGVRDERQLVQRTQLRARPIGRIQQVLVLLFLPGTFYLKACERNRDEARL